MPKQYAFDKTKRITERNQYQELFKKGKRGYGQFLKIYTTNDQKLKNQCGVIVSRHIKGAVIRNRYKRLIREYFRLHQNLFTHVQMAIVVTRRFQPENYDTITKALDPIMKDLRIV